MSLRNLFSIKALRGVLSSDRADTTRTYYRDRLSGCPIRLLAGCWKSPPAPWKVKAEAKAEKKNFGSSLNLDLNLSLVYLLRTIEVLVCRNDFSTACTVSFS